MGSVNSPNALKQVLQERNIHPVKILDVNVHPLTYLDLHYLIKYSIERDLRSRILNVNVNCLNIAYQNEWLRDFLNTAEIVFCDGAGVILAGRFLGHTIPQRITYADWTWQLAKFASENQYSFYFLGASLGTAQLAANRLKQKYPSLRIVGTHHGYFNKDAGSQENEAVIRNINLAKPNILILGFGMPLQEKWLLENWERLDLNVALTGGAVFDYLSGKLKRAPKWMTNYGLEWLGRLVIEPHRLWRRYLVGNTLFLWRILKQKIEVSW